MAVLQRKELEDSPLADLHAIASELGIEGFRTLRKADLVSAILDAQGEGVAGGSGQVAVGGRACPVRLLPTAPCHLPPAP
jgi:transcription termination factor Rho